MSVESLSPLTEAIQLAIAPVFLLTGVAGMLNAIGTRLARVIDRARHLQLQLESGNDGAQVISAERRRKIEAELKTLVLRSRVVNLATALMVGCALAIGLTVVELFSSAGMGERMALTRWASFTFLAGLIAFIAACVMYLVEIIIASNTVNIRLPKD